MTTAEVLSLIEANESKGLATEVFAEWVYKDQKYFSQKCTLGDGAVIFHITRSRYTKLPLTELKRQIKELGPSASSSPSCKVVVDGKNDSLEMSSAFQSDSVLEFIVS